ncbi:PHB depolymerase family esterase [Methylobacterium sp. Leaf466]|uniref:extracellular catalytic domain type 1 short-chain-length polyhydroxyalkanoate depolymerase n=1 Tax=Methylobacterium sp. Leaf466 TaxID=1736386 RepID=UPI0006F8FBD9|nr:PHB depolymerase family esterase [Methylobacterium sp. Leaf466]KQT78435.1 esterase [Methylobacterium sp. Leaf466]
MSESSNGIQARIAEMMEATRMTGAGRLHEATALIQRALTGAAPTSSQPKAIEPRTIDLTAEPVEPRPASSSKTTSASSSTSQAPEAPQAAAFNRAGFQGPVLPERVREVVSTVVGGLGRNVAPLFKGLVPGAAVAPRVAGAGTFSEHAFENAAGARSYKLYVPSNLAARPPLVVMLHGCSQSPDDFAAGTGMNELAEELGFLVVYPGQSGRANGQKCWNWFEPRDQGRDGGEAGIIAGITRAVTAAHGADPARVYIAGLSAGAAAAANVAHAYPDLYAGVGVHSGLAAGCARDLSSALMAMNMGAPGANPPNGFGAPAAGIRIPTIVVHGEGDGTVSPRNGDQVLAQAGIARLEALETPAPQASPGGLAYTRTRYADADGRVLVENWVVKGLGHAWSGGRAGASYTDPRGPDASRAMLTFFLSHSLGH